MLSTVAAYWLQTVPAQFCYLSLFEQKDGCCAPVHSLSSHSSSDWASQWMARTQSWVSLMEWQAPAAFQDMHWQEAGIQSRSRTHNRGILMRVNQTLTCCGLSPENLNASSLSHFSHCQHSSSDTGFLNFGLSQVLTRNLSLNK